MSYQQNSRERGPDRRDEINRKAPMIAGPRLEVPLDVLKQRGITLEGWSVLVDAIYPTASTAAAVLLALDYCKARGLDPFKKPVHVVPVYSKSLKKYVETIWPGINSIQTDAARTKEWAGMDAPVWGEVVKKKFTGRLKRYENGRENWEDVTVEVEFPVSCSVTVYRAVGGARCPFTIPIYWEEAYASQGGTKVPNDMWQKRPRGQLHKCAMAASLRAAFPEDADTTAEEMEGQTVEKGGIVIQGEAEEVMQSAPVRDSQAPSEAAATSNQESPPWGEMMWPYSKPNGEGFTDLLTVEDWKATFFARVQKVRAAPGLDDAARTKLLTDLRDKHREVFGALRTEGASSVVDQVEALIEAALAGRPLPGDEAPQEGSDDKATQKPAAGRGQERSGAK